jgi:8-oxo-dGTP pyrophosphatase MutT (NUDIX family)
MMPNNLFNEVHKYEVFDAYDIDENKLNMDMVRGQTHDEGLYHIVVEILTINEKNQILVTKRHARKNYPLYWEITGGSILKGEDTFLGAERELKEETGIQSNQFKLLYKTVEHDALFRGLLTTVLNPSITLQADETIDYQWVDACDFIEFINRTDFIPTTRRRILHAWHVIEPILFKNEPCL